MVDITFADVTNATTMYDGTGYFDKLMNTMTLHIEEQYTKKRITGTEYSNAYLQIMQVALQSAQSFVLAEKLQEAQIDGIAAENLIKAKQLELETYRLLNIVPAELAALQKQTEVAERGIIVQETQLAEDTYNKEWMRRLESAKIQIDAEMSLYASKRLDKIPSIVDTITDENGQTLYSTLVSKVVKP